jgi:hypothetical protein
MFMHGYSVLTTGRAIHGGGNFFRVEARPPFRLSIENLSQGTVRLATWRRAACVWFFHIGKEIEPGDRKLRVSFPAQLAPPL